MLLKIENEFYNLTDSRGKEITDDHTKGLIIGYIKAINETLNIIKNVYNDNCKMERSFTVSGKITIIESVLKKQGILIKLDKNFIEYIDII